MTGRATKAKQEQTRPSRRPELARAEPLDKPTRARALAELETALKRKPTQEAKLAGALRALAALSPAVRAAMGDAAESFVKRKTLQRELYAACIRAVAEANDRRAPELLAAALAVDDGAPATATLSAACFSQDKRLTAPLAKLAATRQPLTAFAAETARVVRGEASGQLLLSIAPMIKESHRLSLCAELFLPLTRTVLGPAGVGPALAVLRDSERHLGRWLVLGEVAALSGDANPLAEARSRAGEGPSAARAAWALVAWALEGALARAGGAGPVVAPATRPTVEVVARLSDRPSADRDPTFLFRLAAARSMASRAMLESLVKGGLSDEAAVRAASFLARDHGRDDLRSELVECARAGKREDLRGLATASLWDSGAHDDALALADELAASRHLGNVTWAALVRAARSSAGGQVSDALVVTEARLRWVQWGSVE